MGLFGKSLEEKTAEAVKSLRGTIKGLKSLDAVVEGKTVTLTGEAADLETKGKVMAEFNKLVETENTLNKIRIAQAPVAAAPAPAAADAQSADRASAEAVAPSQSFTGVPLAKLGTGHGRTESSSARQVSFVRATTEPAQVLAVQYDRYENLAALGVVPQRPAHVARQAPRPFPGMRFVPDPR